MTAKWIKCSEQLPPEGHLVLGYFPELPWSWYRHEHVNIDKAIKNGCTNDEWGTKYLSTIGEENPKYQIVSLVRGLSKKEKDSMPDCQRKQTEMLGDEWTNNKVPYAWETFGSSTFFGEECEAWCEIPFYENAKTSNEMKDEHLAKYGESTEDKLLKKAFSTRADEMDKASVHLLSNIENILKDDKENGSLKEDFTVLEIDRLTHMNRLYPKEVVQKAIDELNESKNELYVYSKPQDDEQGNFNDIIGVATDLRIDDKNNIVASITPIKDGKNIFKLRNEFIKIDPSYKEVLKFNIAGIGKLLIDGRVSDYHILRIELDGKFDTTNISEGLK